MFIFVEFSDYSLLQEYLCNSQDIDLMEALQIPNFLVKRIKLSQWYDLAQELDTSGNLFEEASEKPYLIDIQFLEIDSKVLSYLEGLNKDLKTEVIFYSSSGGSLGLETKKLWQKNSFQYIELKKADEKVKLKLTIDYNIKLGLELSESKIANLAKQSQNYQEIIDNLDFVYLSENPQKAYESLLIEEKALPFMLGFDVLKADSQVSKWYNLIQEGDIQLALSLIFGKLDKQNSPRARELLLKLILTDQKIKTRGKISPTLWWKLFLWEAKMI